MHRSRNTSMRTGGCGRSCIIGGRNVLAIPKDIPAGRKRRRKESRFAMEEKQQLVFENGYCGIDIDFHEDMHRYIATHLKGGFHFASIPLRDPTYRPSLVKTGTDVLNVWHIGDLLALDTTSNCSNRLIGKISSWIDLDSDDEIVRKDSEISLLEELHLASNHSLQACLLPAPKGSSCSNYIRCVNHILQDLSDMKLLLRIPLEESYDPNGGKNIKYVCESQPNSLKLWRSFHRQCEIKYHNQLSVAFDFPRSLPSADSLKCWSDEPLGVALIDSKDFTSAQSIHSFKAEYHQKLMMWLFKHSVKVVISGTAVYNATITCNQDGDYRKHRLGMDLELTNLAYGFFLKHYFGKEVSTEVNDVDRGSPDDDDFGFYFFD